METPRKATVLSAGIVLAVLAGLGIALTALAPPEGRAIVALGYAAVAVAVLAAVMVGVVVYRSRQAVHHAQSIIERASDAIITVDETGAIETLNEAAVEIFGYRPTELIGCSLSVLLTSAYIDEEDGTLWDFLRRNAIRATGTAQEVRGLRKDGTKFYMDLSVSDVTHQDVAIFVAIMRDVTERKRSQLALRKASEELEQRVHQRTAELEAANAQLSDEIRQRRESEAEREKVVEELRKALAEIKTLSGLIPICASCKKVRDDSGYWNQIEVYVRQHSQADFSHSLCPECVSTLYPELGEPEGGAG